MILALLLATAAPAGTLTLDADDPVIVADVAGQRLRLRVDLDQRDAVELNPDVAARLPVKWERGFTAGIGEIELGGRKAKAVARIGGETIPLNLSEHGRACCAGVDGAIGADMLPYAEVRFVRRVAAGRRTTLPLRRSDGDGLTVAEGPLAVQLSLARDETVASKAAGVLLAEAHGGRWAGPFAMRAEAFGVRRPARPLAFAGPATILGFPFDRILVRSDYGRGHAMAEDRPRAGDIVVRARPVGRDWALVSLGRDRLSRCAEIVYRAEPPSLELDCNAAPAPAHP